MIILHTTDLNDCPKIFGIAKRLSILEKLGFHRKVKFTFSTSKIVVSKVFCLRQKTYTIIYYLTKHLISQVKTTKKRPKFTTIRKVGQNIFFCYYALHLENHVFLPKLYPHQLFQYHSNQ